MEKVFEKTPLNKVVRGAKRAVYDKEQVYEILDSAFLCYVGFSMADQPHIIPTSYVRSGNEIYIHGSTKSRMILALANEANLCINVTHLDGLVLARSAFHHSVNYRSVMVFGKARIVEDQEEKMEALKKITNNVLEGRWDEVRQPNQKEMDITTVLAISIDSAAAKVRTGDPVDDKEDYELPIWAGVLPITPIYQQAIDDAQLASGLKAPESVRNALK